MARPLPSCRETLTHLEVPADLWGRAWPQADTDHADEVHAPDGDGGKAQGCNEEQGEVAESATGCAPAEDEQGGIGAEDGDKN